MTFDFKFYLSIFFRRFHYFVLILAVVAASGITVAMMLPPKYEAEALLLIEQPQIPTDLAASTVQGVGPRVEIQIIRQQITTRATVLEIADKMQVYPNRSALDPNAVIADMRNRITIADRIQRGSAPTVSVRFSARDPQLAAAVTNELVTRILELNVEMRTGNATQTLEFFEQEAARLEQEVQVKSNRILEFKLQNQNALPESLDFRRAQQTALQNRAIQIERDIAGLQERRVNLVDLFERTGRVDTVAANLTPEQRQLQQLQSELDSALLVYSEQNPRVRVLQTKIASLQAAVAAQGGSEDEDAPSLFELQLSDIDAQIEILERQRGETEEALAELAQSVEETPANAIRLGELNRSLDLSQQQLSETMRNLSTAQMGERIEVMSKGQRLSVVESAVVPRTPVSPNRQLIAAASVGAGFALGLALVVLLELLTAAIRRPVEIKNKLGITPLATLPYIRTRRQTVVRRTIIVGVIALAVIGFPAIIWALHTYYLPLDLLVERVLQQSGIASLLASFSGVPG